MEIIKGNYRKIVDIIIAAKYQVITIMPNISVEIATALSEVNKRIKNVIVYLDIREEIYREGYGDIEALTTLQEGRVKIMQLQDCSISFIIVDNNGFFYFPKSRFFEKEGSSFDMVPMVPEQVQLFTSAFSSVSQTLSVNKDQLHKDHIELALIKENATPLSEVKHKEIAEKLQKDPPLKPDLKRTLNVYTAKFQFVELKFRGANFHVKKVKLPPNALPFKDSQLSKAIEANLRLFTNLPDKDFFQPFFDFKNNMEEFRGNYLVYLKTREKNVIRRDNKSSFLLEIKKLEEQLKKITEEISNELQREIVETRDRIFKTLREFLVANPLPAYNGYTLQLIYSESDYDARKIVSKIKFPDSKSLLSNVAMECYFYDITWEDLNNRVVIEEMIDKELLDKKEGAYLLETAISASKS